MDAAHRFRQCRVFGGNRYVRSNRTGRVLAAVAGVVGMAFSTSGLAAEATFSGDSHVQWKTIEKYCFGCHNTEDWAGSVAFDTMSADSIAQEGKVFETAIKKLKGGLMPPPGKDQPTKEATAQLIAFLETTLDKAQAKPYAGHIPLRRLN